MEIIAKKLWKSEKKLLLQPGMSWFDMTPGSVKQKTCVIVDSF